MNGEKAESEGGKDPAEPLLMHLWGCNSGGPAKKMGRPGRRGGEWEARGGVFFGGNKKFGAGCFFWN